MLGIFLAGQCAQGHRETFKGALRRPRFSESIAEVESRFSWICCKRRIIALQKGVCEIFDPYI